MTTYDLALGLTALLIIFSVGGFIADNWPARAVTRRGRASSRSRLERWTDR